MVTKVGIGSRLQEERKRLGYNQTDFAALGGVAKNTQWFYEKDERSPDVAYLAAIEKIGVDIWYLLYGERKPQTVSDLNSSETKVIQAMRKMSEVDRASIERLVWALSQASE
jgi:transcriptional regulator with XRE-family HTH domain